MDVYQHKQDSLQGDPSFNFVRRNAYPSGDGLVFVNLDLFSDLWRGRMESRLTPLGYQAAAFPVYGLSYMPGVVSKYKMIVGLDEKYMPSGMRKTFACPALTNDSMKFVPDNAIAYNWGGCYDFESVLGRGQKEIGRVSPSWSRGFINSRTSWKNISRSISKRMFCLFWAMRSAVI